LLRIIVIGICANQLRCANQKSRESATNKLPHRKAESDRVENQMVCGQRWIDPFLCVVYHVWNGLTRTQEGGGLLKCSTSCTDDAKHEQCTFLQAIQFYYYTLAARIYFGVTYGSSDASLYLV